MKTFVVIASMALTGCSVEGQVAEAQRQAVAEHKGRFCAMTESQKMAYLRRRIAVANAQGGYVNGKYVDTTVVLNSELGAERHEWRKATGC